MADTPNISLPDGQRVVPISTTASKWTDDFGGNAIDNNRWEVETDIGPMVRTVSASALGVNMGVISNAELRLLSRETFTVPFDLGVSFMMNQRIASNEVYFEVVEVDDLGVPVVNPLLAGDWNNRAAIRLNGTSSSQHSLDSIGEGANAVLNVSTTSAISTSGIVDTLMEVRPQDVVTTSVAANAFSGKSGSGLRASSSVPDPNKQYKVRLRFKNTGAPASGTVVNVYRVIVADVQELGVEIVSGRGDTGANKGVPVNLTGTVAARDANGLFTEISSAAIIATTTINANLAPDNGGGGSAVFVFSVTAVSGTAPTLDIGIEESDDTGTNWYRIWDMPRITATGIYRSPVIMLSGNRIRYVHTVGGTTPSFTRSVSRLAQYNVSAPIRRCFFDRTLSLNTNNAATAAFLVEGCSVFHLTVSSGPGATSTPTIQFQGSDDGVNWFATGGQVNATANTTVLLTLKDILPKFIRAVVGTPGVAAVLNYLMLKGQE